ncbi:hypothetical protein AB0E69_15375 [Kribbella sp. NPDC026611]|uniref:hypothetical protein n=1 Tax=Kribbella sp. NPDC026611 TaxID=3154911 RepID=UPI0033C6A0DE
MKRKYLAGAAAVLFVAGAAAVPTQADATVEDSGGYYASLTSCQSQGNWQISRAGHIYHTYACDWEPHDPPFHLYLY